MLDLLVIGNFSVAQGMNEDFICNDKYTDEIFEKVSLLKHLQNWKEIDKFMCKEYKMQWVNFRPIIKERNLKYIHQNQCLQRITKKVKQICFADHLEELEKLYIANTKNDDLAFLDLLLNLEPMLKQEICHEHITEKEMYYLIETYSAFINDKAIVYDY